MGAAVAFLDAPPAEEIGAMNETQIQYAVVLTSCARFDLLRRTAESFLQYADVAPAQFIVVEDSGDEDGVRAALAGLDFPFEFVINRPPLGQYRAIGAGYARVKTPLVFHCEDDWLFFRPGFIRESFVLLQKFPEASVVFLRGRDEQDELRDLPYEEHEGVIFFRAALAKDKIWFGYGFNPGLRRLADYRRFAPVAQIGSEDMISYVFKRAGFYSAHLEVPAVVHLGGGKTSYAKNRPKVFSFAYPRYKARKLCRKWMAKLAMWRLRLFGFSEKRTARQ